MACRDAYEMELINRNEVADVDQSEETVMTENLFHTDRLLFGVDSRVQADDILQNNLTEFEWVTKNKLYPNFWGRYIAGAKALSKEEIAFIHKKGCKIAAIYDSDIDAMETEEEGSAQAEKAVLAAFKLGIPEGTAIFLEILESANATAEYMKGYAQSLLAEGYLPGFKANTDANYSFDREYSRGMQDVPELFAQCLVWAVAPSLEEYDHITTTHLIHPDDWTPYAPSGITRDDIAVWQYGKECHPIRNDRGEETFFHIDLVKDEDILINKMF